jgi:hypothetical protein
LCIKVLKLVVLGHELGQNPCKFFNLRGKFQLTDQPIGVFFKLFWLDLLICVDVVDSLVQMLDFLPTLLVLASFVVLKVFQENLSCQLSEGCRENVRFKLEELIDHVLVLNTVKDVSCKSYNIFKRFIKEMALKA